MARCNCCGADVAAMRAEIESLQEQVRQERLIRKASPGAPKEWGLSPREADIVGDLAAHASVFEEHYVDRNAIKVAVHYIRQKLAPFGITIQTWKGRGYWVDRDSLAVLRAAMGVA